MIDHLADRHQRAILVRCGGELAEHILPAALGASLPMPLQLVGMTGIIASKVELPTGELDLNLVTTAGLAMGAVR